jgi:hypothetical protein
MGDDIEKQKSDNRIFYSFDDLIARNGPIFTLKQWLDFTFPDTVEEISFPAYNISDGPLSLIVKEGAIQRVGFAGENHVRLSLLKDGEPFDKLFWRLDDIYQLRVKDGVVTMHDRTLSEKSECPIQ